jgi:hypothetical protein
MEWLYYLLEANLYLLLFYGFYCLLLRNETFYNLNRFYLITSTLLSFALPVLQLGWLKPSITQNLNNISPVNNGIENPEVNWFYMLYLFIAFCLAVKLSLSIYKIISLWLKAKKHTTGDVTLIELNGEATAFSFFNLLFIHPTMTNQIAVIKHEMVHIKQKHSFDVLFFELIQIACWFNPIIHFIKKDVKLLHEYIADQLTTNADIQKHEYALFLIQNSFGLRAQHITNQIFNQSILKRRINMLNKKRTAGWARLRLLLALPLATGMLCVSTMAFTKDYGYVDLLPEKSEIAAIIQEKTKVDTLKKGNGLKTTNTRKKNQVKFPPPIVKADKPSKSLKSPPPPVEPPPPHKKDVVKFPPPIIKADKPNKSLKAPPPPPKQDQIKFPPPIIKSDKQNKSLKAPPPPPKQDQIKFPPPIIKSDKQNKSLKAPPPKQDQIKFPPPVVKPTQKKISPKMVEGDPIKQPEMLEVVIKADPTKSRNKVNDELKEVIIKKVDPVEKKTNNKQ